MCAPSRGNIKTTYWVFFQWFHEKGVPKDQPAVFGHLGLLLWAKGKTERQESLVKEGLVKEAGQDCSVLLIPERGNSLILPFRICFYCSKSLIYYPDSCELECHTK